MEENHDKEKFNVFIVDDIQENLQVLATILSQKGISISAATNGIQAIKGIIKKKPDLVLLDVSMPIMDGYEVCKRLKEIPETKDIPIIFLTARSQNDEIVKGFEAGAVDYITKPFEQSELLSRIFTHLNLKKSRDIINTQNIQLIELNKSKNRLFGIIAHDLKNPFIHILGYTSLILEDSESYEKEEILEIINRLNHSAKNTYTLLENLLDWARIQINMVHFSPEIFSLSEIIDKNTQILNELAKEKDISILNEVIQELKIRADKNMINTVLRNLISNAIKFSYSGSSIKIKVDLQKDSDLDSATNVLIEIQDHGTGIKEEDIDKLFYSDKEYSTIGTNNEKGTGLGLIICKELIEKNGGTIWVKSKVNEGSSFFFTLPAAI